jgi:two-component system LytT family response regulator
MLKAFIIDDDLPSIKILEYFLKEYDTVEIAGCFTDPLTALEQFKEKMPQLVFLDINMSQLNGMETASRIIDLCPETDIIFTTAYDGYAVDAFEINAADYIVKPIIKARFDKSMERIIKKAEPAPVENEKLFIRCFGKFSIYWQNKEPIKWRTEKSKELAALLICNEGQEVTRDEIIEQLWAETDLDRAIHYLHNSIYYIRKSFSDYGINRSYLKISGNYSVLMGKDVECDFEKYATMIKKPDKTIEMYETVRTLCRSEFMEGEDWNWAVLERENFTGKCIETAISLSRHYMENGNFPEAELVLKQAYSKDPYDETITAMLIKLYIARNQKLKAIKHFNDFSSLIKNDLGIHPGKYIKELISSIS